MREPDVLLRRAATVFAAGLLLHTADHFRRGTDILTKHVLAAGTLSTLAAVVVLALVFTRHRWAPAAAAALGLSMAFGVTAAHLLPTWSAFSDSLPDGHVSAVTWVAVLLEIAGAALMGAAGLAALRPREPARTG
ncbi:MAG TPA: hypothetical protein VGB03_05235 [Acidimicrobiales bacterium]|jgi:uncharacterized membrane protein YfhO